MLKLSLLLGDLTIQVRMQKALRMTTKMKQAMVLPLEMSQGGLQGGKRTTKVEG